jgi:hypothetical protein
MYKEAARIDIDNSRPKTTMERLNAKFFALVFYHHGEKRLHCYEGTDPIGTFERMVSTKPELEYLKTIAFPDDKSARAFSRCFYVVAVTAEELMPKVHADFLTRQKDSPISTHP